MTHRGGGHAPRGARLRPRQRRISGAVPGRREWHVLEVLARDPGRLVEQRDVLREVWGGEQAGGAHALRQHIAQLRRKLEPEPARPRHVLTEPGLGYRFEV